jgi:hypothetical protein
MFNENGVWGRIGKANKKHRLSEWGAGLLGAVVILGAASEGRAAESLWSLRPSAELRQQLQNLTPEQKKTSQGFDTTHHAGFGELTISDAGDEIKAYIFHYDGQRTYTLNVDRGILTPHYSNNRPGTEKLLNPPDVDPATYAEYIPAFQGILSLVKFMESYHATPPIPMNWDRPHLTPLRKYLASTLATLIGGKMRLELATLSSPKTIERGYATTPHAGRAILRLSAKEVEAVSAHESYHAIYTLNLEQETLTEKMDNHGPAATVKTLALTDGNVVSALQAMLNIVSHCESHHEGGPGYPMNWEDDYLKGLGLRSFLQAKLNAVR